MKIIIYFLLFITSLQAQNFFPLKVDNAYFFKHSYDYGGLSYSTFTVNSDSIINEEVFYRFSNGPEIYCEDCYFRYDTLEQKVFVKIPGDDTIRLAIDFMVPAYEWITSYITGQAEPFRSEGIAKRVLQGDSILSYKMGWPPYTYIFSENIGASYHFHIGNLTNEYKLISAIIDTFVYNPIHLTLDTIKPLINRPAATFPFVIFGEYTTNYNVVDSFYLTVKHVREEDTLGTYIYKFNKSKNLQIPIMPEPGDKLLLRAVIRDISIFHNYDTLPDTGFAEILVLENPTDAGEYNQLLSFSLEQNYPNPFNPSTIIKYSVASSSFVTLKVYDVLGNEIAALINEEKQPGIFTIEFNGAGLTSGVYFYRLSAGDRTDIKKMIMMK